MDHSHSRYQFIANLMHHHSKQAFTLKSKSNKFRTVMKPDSKYFKMTNLFGMPVQITQPHSITWKPMNLIGYTFLLILMHGITSFIQVRLINTPFQRFLDVLLQTFYVNKKAIKFFLVLYSFIYSYWSWYNTWTKVFYGKNKIKVFSVCHTPYYWLYRLIV